MYDEWLTLLSLRAPVAAVRISMLALRYEAGQRRLAVHLSPPCVAKLLRVPLAFRLWDEIWALGVFEWTRLSWSFGRGDRCGRLGVLPFLWDIVGLDQPGLLSLPV